MMCYYIYLTKVLSVELYSYFSTFGLKQCFKKKITIYILSWTNDVSAVEQIDDSINNPGPLPEVSF